MAIKQNCPAGGSITIAAADTANNYTITLPASTGTLTTTNDIPSPFSAGTVIVFGQTAAPTGWTKVTTYDNAALRIVSGTASSGGSVNFTTAFTSQSAGGTVGSYTLASADIPSHTHSGVIVGRQGAGGGYDWPIYGVFGNTAATGGGGAHSHTFTGTTINLAVKYVDVIFASKN